MRLGGGPGGWLDGAHPLLPRGSGALVLARLELLSLSPQALTSRRANPLLPRGGRCTFGLPGNASVCGPSLTSRHDPSPPPPSLALRIGASIDVALTRLDMRLACGGFLTSRHAYPRTGSFVNMSPSASAASAPSTSSNGGSGGAGGSILQGVWADQGRRRQKLRLLQSQAGIKRQYGSANALAQVRLWPAQTLCTPLYGHMKNTLYVTPVQVRPPRPYVRPYMAP